MGSAMDVQGLGSGQSELLDLIDKVQFAQIGNENLPQIAVVGDQSSGKSSVLTSLTGIPFSRSAMACTRYATEIRLRRDARRHTKVWIIPDPHRPKNERDDLEAFGGELESDTAEVLAASMRTASELISPTRQANGNRAPQSSRFATNDKLIIQRSGPNEPLLTVVDLPGLVKIPSSEQTAADLQTMEALSDAYMKDPRTIILAVVSGSADFVQCIILEKAAAFDPKGTRTIGVLTKPDLTEAQGYTEKYIGLVTRQDPNTKYHFKLGWYVLLNPGPSENPTLEQRKRQEADFFMRGTWGMIPPDMRGADALRAQLSLQLQRAIARRIKSIQRQIQEVEDECDAKLESLGVGMDTPEEMREELGRLFTLSNSLVEPAVNGTYRNPPDENFFKNERDPKGTPVQNLRARVWGESETFARRFRQLGRKLNFIDEHGKVDAHAKAEFTLREVEPLLVQIKGRELPFDPNTRAPYMLFSSHSKRWPHLARDYQENIVAICHAFLSELVDYAWPIRMQSPLREHFLKTKLSEMLAAAKTELNHLNKDKHEIQPFDPEYEEALMKVAKEAAEKNLHMTEAERVVEQMLAYYKVKYPK